MLVLPGFFKKCKSFQHLVNPEWYFLTFSAKTIFFRYSSYFRAFLFNFHDLYKEFSALVFVIQFGSKNYENILSFFVFTLFFPCCTVFFKRLSFTGRQP